MSSFALPLQFLTPQGAQEKLTILSTAVIAGWTGRDRVAMEKHIVELEALGVPRPQSTPIYYRVAAARLTVEPRIEVSGGDSSGEVEFVLLQLNGRLWVGVGSDHTDRKLETQGITLSKQICDKPIAPQFWPFEQVADHWDRLILRSFIFEGGERRLYQEGSVTTMLDPRELIAGWRPGNTDLPEGTIMFCGTLAAKGGIRPAGWFDFQLEDPVLNRTISHGYEIQTLPIAG